MGLDPFLFWGSSQIWSLQLAPSVKLRPLAPGDLVLRKVVGNTKNPAWGKLWPNWEGPYHITSVAGIGAYYLEDLDEKTVLHHQNVNNLKRYYY